MSQLLKIAIQEIGVKEIEGPQGHNLRIIDYAHESGFTWVNDDETPWCSIFMNWCAKKASLQRSEAANARSWQLTGQATENPEPGDVVVFWRQDPLSWKGHVGIFMGYSKNRKRIYCLGGNQGNQVSITAYDSKRLLAFRRLSNVKAFKLANKNLQLGSTGDAVALLQDALKMLNFDCGTSDGIFGPKTEGCVKDLQATSGAIEVTGVVNKATRSYIEERLKA